MNEQVAGVGEIKGETDDVDQKRFFGFDPILASENDGSNGRQQKDQYTPQYPPPKRHHRKPDV